MEKQEEKPNFFLQLSGYFIIFLMFLIWLMDRTLHIILPHREHLQFTSWAKEPANVKYAFARLFIFSLPILIYNIIV